MHFFALLVFWAADGYCGTPHPGPPGPPGPPFRMIAAIVGGILGGWVFSLVFPTTEMTGIATAATGLGAFVGGRVLSDAAGLARAGR